MAIKWILLVSLPCILFYAFYPQIENFFVFYPEAQFDSTPVDWRLTSEDVSFEAEDRTKLHGWFFPLKGKGPVILFCHGNAGNMSHRLQNIRFLVDQGLQVFIFDYRGYGKSVGRPSEGGLYRDGVAAYDFLVNEKHIPPAGIVLFGRSLGAAVAVEIAMRRDVRSIILESAFTSTKEMANTMPLFKIFSFLLPSHYNNLKKIPGITVPKLIIHGEEDRLVPFSMGQKLYRAAGAPKLFFPIKNAGHNDTYLFGGKKYFETLSDFVRQARTGQE